MATARNTTRRRSQLPRIIRRGRLVALVAVLALMHGADAPTASASTAPLPQAPVTVAEPVVIPAVAMPDTALRAAGAPESLGPVEARR
jgi:hypothetical protein